MFITVEIVVQGLMSLVSGLASHLVHQSFPLLLQQHLRVPALFLQLIERNENNPRLY